MAPRKNSFARPTPDSINTSLNKRLLYAWGVEFLTTPQTTPGGLAEIATCMDPDGTLIELLQVHLDKWPTINSGQ